MDKLKNKNTIVLIISAILILIAIIVAVVATASSGKDKKTKDTTTPSDSVSIDLASIADLNNTSTTKEHHQQTSYSFEPGKYKIATKDDPQARTQYSFRQNRLYSQGRNRRSYCGMGRLGLCCI